MARAKPGEDPQFFRDGIVYREWGHWFSNNEVYYLAETYFEKAIKQGQDKDLRTYLGLCKTQLSFARYFRATKTVKKCEEIDPTYSDVKYKQLQALFHVGEFEYSLIHAHQGYRKRPTSFLLHGVYQGNETVEDCVGKNTHPKALLLLRPWIEKLGEYREMMIEKLKEEVDEFEGIDEEQSRFKVDDPEARAEAAHRKLRRVIAKIYLGHLAHDKEFLQKLFECRERLESPNKKSTEELYQFSMRNYGRAVHRQNILRMRKPLYVMLFRRRAAPVGYKIMVAEEKKLRRNLIIIQADFLLHRLHAIRMKKDYTTFFRMVDRVKDKFDSYSPKMFPLKQRCLDTMYEMVAWMYISTRDLSKLKSIDLKKTYLKHHIGIRVAELPRDCDIGWVRAINGKEALRVFRRRLAMASKPLELAWLFHELCKYLIDIRRYDLARFYGKKARDMGEEAGSELWVLNTLHLFVRIEISQNYRNEAKEAVILALTSAKKLGIDFLVQFYGMMLEIVDEVDVDKMQDFDAIATRQQLILDLMPDSMKPTVDYIWRSMQAVPAKRRMSVMPGCKPVDKKTKLPCKRMSIFPSPALNPEKEARKALLKQYDVTLERPGFLNVHEFD